MLQCPYCHLIDCPAWLLQPPLVWSIANHPPHLHFKRSASFKRRSYTLRGISVTPNVARCGVQNCTSCNTTPRAFKCSTSATRHTFEASVACENILSPIKAPPSDTPYSPPASMPSFHASTLWASPA